MNRNPTPIEISSAKLTESAIGIENQYRQQQGLDAYSHVIEHANKRTAAFDKKVLASHDGVIEHKKGDLVQVQDSHLDFTLATEVKLLPHWGPPHRIVDCIRNSYQLEMIQGLPMGMAVCARRLQQFVPHLGTTLGNEQLEIKAWRVGLSGEVMEGLDLEEEGDQDEGEVEDVILGDRETGVEVGHVWLGG